MSKRLFFSLIIVGTLLSGLFPRTASAAIKDSDFDGLSDIAEQTAYMTNPSVADTDRDGIFDGVEVLAQTNPLDSASSRLVDLAMPDPNILSKPIEFNRYFGPASGIFAFLTLTLVVCFDLLMGFRFMARLFLPETIDDTHRFLSVAAVLAVVMHAASLLSSDFFSASFTDAVASFFLEHGYQFALGLDFGKVAGLGIIASYFVLLLVFTSALYSKMSPPLWRIAAAVSFVVYLLIGDGIFPGSDSGERWVRTLYVASIVSVSILMLLRIVFRKIVSEIKAAERGEETSS